ncbi:hypothetical protein [Longimicrobium terrae]|uniref:Uncharacterized protein n=1 Tax=Longimicrobium terrae TaxID=1639882 RepID=A0A841GX10_9BACT|nr:hypothetical protein [Longimicrobium terrae]MBB6069186.1 hypothetical protein [Longimicrobium terrae]NNC32001.1 hypothetical protein [Longimicrobium terrae]
MMHFYDRLREVDRYKNTLAEGLRVVLGGWADVQTEWDAILPEERAYFPYRKPHARRMYSPAVDIAVGPFAVRRQYISEYDELLAVNRPFIESLADEHQRNVGAFGSDFHGPDFQALQYGNLNARCFVAVEIEKGNAAAKYLIGSALNAAALGRVGIVVCWSEDRLHTLLRIREYLCLLMALEKNAFSPRNLLVLTRGQMDAVVASS